MSKMLIVVHAAIKIFFFREKEGPRAHVHIKHKDGTEAKVWLDDLSLKESSRDSVFDKLAVKLAEKYKEESLQAWEDVYGE